LPPVGFRNKAPGQGAKPSQAEETFVFILLVFNAFFTTFLKEMVV